MTSLKMLAALAATLETLQPVRVPGFAFPWLELISHRRDSRLLPVSVTRSLPASGFARPAAFSHVSSRLHIPLLLMVEA